MTLISLLACMGMADSAGSELGTQTWTSDAGNYTVEFSTDPDPLSTGNASFTVSAPGSTDLGFDALMESMGHGLSEDPVISGADGAWTVDCTFTMSGTWLLTFTLDGAAGTDTASGEVEVW
jgi:hypothetical protein